MNRYLVSVITPNYNGEKFIIDTIKSVKSQTYTNWEMIIVDDNSKDNSISLIENFIKDDLRIKLIKNTSNLGAAVSRNIAIEKAKGRFIAFLDGDDIWKSIKLEEQLKFMMENKYPFTYSYYDQITEDGDFIRNVTDIALKINYNKLLSKNIIGCLTAIYDTTYFGKVYMPLIRKRQDFGLWLELLKKTTYAYCCNLNLADYRIRQNSVSSNKMALIKYHWNLYYKIEDLGFFYSIYLVFLYIVNAIRK